MITVIKKPFTGVKFSESEASLKLRELSDGFVDGDYYLITLSASENDQLDLIRSVYLKDLMKRDLIPPVVGIASDKAEAVLVTDLILEETYKNTGTYDMRTYLMSGSAE